MTVIHYRSFTDLSPECSPTVTPPDLCQRYTVGRVNPPAAHREALLTHSNFQQHGQSLASSAACTFQHCPLFQYLCQGSEKSFIVIFTPGLSVCLFVGREDASFITFIGRINPVQFNWDLILHTWKLHSLICWPLSSSLEQLRAPGLCSRALHLW